MELRYATELPPGAQVYGTAPSARGIDKNEVEKDLRTRPKQWALVYENTSHKTAADWAKRPGFESAHKLLPNQGNINPGNKRYKVWVRYVGIEGEPEAPQQSITETGLPVTTPEAESVPVNLAAPAPGAPTAPAPLSWCRHSSPAYGLPAGVRGGRDEQPGDRGLTHALGGGGSGMSWHRWDVCCRRSFPGVANMSRSS